VRRSLLAVAGPGRSMRRTLAPQFARRTPQKGPGCRETIDVQQLLRKDDNKPAYGMAFPVCTVPGAKPASSSTRTPVSGGGGELVVIFPQHKAGYSSLAGVFLYRRRLREHLPKSCMHAWSHRGAFQTYVIFPPQRTFRSGIGAAHSRNRTGRGSLEMGWSRGR
jgi:hypothetical protein